MSTTSVSKTYPYKPRKLISLLCLVFFGLGAWFFIEEAQTNEVGLDIVMFRQVLESFSPQEANRIYWGLAIFCSLFSIVGLLSFYKSLTSKALLILTEEGITVPRRILLRETEIQVLFKDIVSLEMHKVNRKHILKIIHHKGHVHVSEDMLANKNCFKEVCDYILERVEAQV